MAKKHSHEKPVGSPKPRKVKSGGYEIRPVKRVGKSSEPENKDSFGFILWQILGGKNANIPEAARRLKVDAGYLRKIIHGAERILEKSINQKQWHAVLAQYYSDGWWHYQSEFEKRASALHSKRGPKFCEPEDKDGIGFTLWHILGGANVNIAEAAGRLNVPRNQLSQIIHGKKRISQQTIIKKQWPKTLARYYPDGWCQHQSEFEKRTSALPNKLGRLPSEPEDKDGIGFVLWQMLGGKNADMNEAAKRLNVPRNQLSQIIHGKKRISQQTIAKKQWPESLARYYPDGWRHYQSEFEKRTSALRSKRGRKFREPEDNDGIGFVLWQILGGKNADIAEAAKRLEMHKPYLSEVIHGKAHILQQTIAKKQWPESLAKYYPDGWRQYRLAFEKRASALHSKRGPKFCEPEDKDGIGFTLWHILGRANVNIAEAAGRLNVPRKQLSQIIHGKKRISQQTITEKQWPETLARYYPDGWRQHQSEFEKRTSALPNKLGRLPREPAKKIIKDWRKEAGELVSTILADRGDEIADILPHVKAAVLKKPEIWEKIAQGDQTVKLNLWKAALREVCNLYNLEGAKEPNRQYAMLLQLMSKLTKRSTGTYNCTL